MTKPLTPREKARRAYVRAYDRWWAKHPGIGEYSNPQDALLRPRRPIDVREGIKIAQLQADLQEQWLLEAELRKEIAHYRDLLAPYLEDDDDDE